MNQTNEGLSKSKGLMHIYSPECPCGLCEQEKAKAAAAEKEADPLNDELQAMRSVARTLEKLEPPARVRVVEWVRARFADQGYGELQGALNRQLAKDWAPR